MTIAVLFVGWLFAYLFDVWMKRWLKAYNRRTAALAPTNPPEPADE